jgi:DNA-directed RNA polymerase alpha subunit
MKPPGRKYRDRPADPTVGMSEAEKAQYQREQALAVPVAELGLPVRVINALEDLDVILCRDLVARHRDGLVQAHILSVRTLENLAGKLRALGLQPHPSWAVPPPARKRKTRRK